MDFIEPIPLRVTLFFILYGITGVVPLLAAVYLLLRKGNAFAPDITPPLRLRRWAASFFAVSALGHVWWLLFYIIAGQTYSIEDGVSKVGYVTVVMLDCVTQLTTIAGTLLAMLQDRRRPVWPVFAGMLPFVAMGVALLIYPSIQLLIISIAYILLLFLLFTLYILFAVRRYGRWLRDNYADLEHKKVWLSLTVILGCTLLFILYVVISADSILIFVLHIAELILFGLLLWRVETLSQLTPEPAIPAEAPAQILSKSEGKGITNETLAQIEQLLAERCVAKKLYLQHDLTITQLALVIGVNRFYLSQYFSRQGLNYNTYINGLRINHFISRYHEVASTHQPFTVQQLASDSGYRSYSTFSLAFKQRMGESFTAWMRKAGDLQYDATDNSQK